MKKLIVLLMLLLPLGAFTQELKIAYVNAQEIFDLMPERTDAETKFAAISAQYQNDLTSLQNEYTAKYEEYMKIEKDLTENLKLRKQQEINDLQERLSNFYQQAQQDLQQEEQKLYAPLNEKLINAIKAVGEEQGYTVVLNPQTAFYIGNSAIDATQLVKTKLGIR